MTDVEVYEGPPAAPATTQGSVAPLTEDDLDLIERQAGMLAKSGIIPRAYRGHPENIVVAAMTGRAFGWDVMTAMRNGHVIEGVWALRPEAMVALIRGAGHRINGDTSTEGATVTGTRCDTGESATVTFTIADAYRANLCRLGQNGQPWARSDGGKPMPWEQYPEDMCWWRAVARLARRLFSDVIMGLSYIPEELGAVVDADGEVIEVEGHDAPALPAAGSTSTDAHPLGQVVSAENADKLVARCKAEGVDLADVVRKGTDGRTDDAKEIRRAEIQPVKAALDYYIEARDKAADAA